MEMFVQVAELFDKHGFSIILMTYFLVKDWRQTSQIIDTLKAINQVLTELRTWHAKEEN